MIQTVVELKECKGCRKRKAPEDFYIDHRSNQRKKMCIDCTTLRRHNKLKQSEAKKGFYKVVKNPILDSPPKNNNLCK